MQLTTPLVRSYALMLIAIIATLCTNAGSAASTVITNEFWVSTNTPTGDLGTLSDPFDGSTQTKFDAVMNKVPANSTIHILAGTYQTAGNQVWTVKSGQQILGSGVDVTTLHLTNNSSQGTVAICDSGTANTNIAVSDLTIDEAGSTNIHGVFLGGSHIRLSRLKLINLNSSGGAQVFGLTLSGCPPYSDGNLIEECEVSSFIDSSYGACDGISVWGVTTNYTTAVLRNNRIILPPDFTNSLVGFNLNYNANTLLDGNYVVGATVAVVANTANTNVSVANNTFKNCFAGLYAVNGPESNLALSFNTIELGLYGGWVTALWLDGNSHYTNVIVIGNTIKLYGAYGGYMAAVSAPTVQGMVMANNSIDSRAVFNTSGAQNINCYNNVDLTGNAYVAANQIQPPNGVTRTAITATPYTLSYADRYVGVQRADSTSLTLPSAIGYPGKEFIVVQEGSLHAAQSVTISAPGGQSVNGAASVSLTTTYQALTITSDGSNWFAR